MTTQEFKKQIDEIIEGGNSTFDSAAKNYCSDELEEVDRIGAEDIEEEGDNISKIYKLDDGFVIIVDTSEIDYCYFSSQIDQAQKVATDKIYETLGL